MLLGLRHIVEERERDGGGVTLFEKSVVFFCCTFSFLLLTINELFAFCFVFVETQQRKIGGGEKKWGKQSPTQRGKRRGICSPTTLPQRAVVYCERFVLFLLFSR